MVADEIIDAGEIAETDVGADAQASMDIADEPGQDAAVLGEQQDRNLDIVMQIPVNVEVMLGSVSMPVSKLLQLSAGSVLALDHYVSEPVDLKVNGRKIAEGELVVLGDETSRFAVKLTKILDDKSALGAH